MPTYEYMTKTLPFKGLGLFGKDVPRLDEILNAAGREGWRLVATVDSKHEGTSDELGLVFMRERA